MPPTRHRHLPGCGGTPPTASARAPPGRGAAPSTALRVRRGCASRARRNNRSWIPVLLLSGQPTLAALEALHVAEALALTAAHAQVELLDVFVRGELGGRAVHHDA